MTRPFYSMVDCPQCGHRHPAESGFNAWLRAHPDFDSIAEGIVRFDCDVLLHRYMRKIDGVGIRDIQCLMFIEVKSYGALIRAAQHDTLSVMSQVFRNRRPNMHQKRQGLHAENHVPPALVYSHMLKKQVRLWLFGGFLLTMSGADPGSSEWMTWGGCRPIDVPTLIGLLKFDLDPEKLTPIDWRRRSRSGKPPPLFDFGDVA